MPVKISFICVQYCSGSALSKPHSSSTLLISWGFAFLPAIRAAGLVAGTTLKIRKTRIEIAMRTAIAPNIRRIRKRSMAQTGPIASGSAVPARASKRTFDFGSRASRSPSPKTFTESTVKRIAVPGMIVRIGVL